MTDKRLTVLWIETCQNKCDGPVKWVPQQLTPLKIDGYRIMDADVHLYCDTCLRALMTKTEKLDNFPKEGDVPC